MVEKSISANKIREFKSHEEAMKACDRLVKGIQIDLKSYALAKDCSEKEWLREKTTDESEAFLKRLPRINWLMGENEDKHKRALNLYVIYLYSSIVVNNSLSKHKIFDDDTADVLEGLADLYMREGYSHNGLLATALERKLKFDKINDIKVIDPDKVSLSADKTIIPIVSDVSTFLRVLTGLSFLSEGKIKKIIDDADKRFGR